MNLCFRSIGKNGDCVAESTPPNCVASGSSTVDTVVAQPRVTVSSAGACGCLPIPYKFPQHNVRQGLLTALQSGQPMNSKHRSELLEAIYVDVTKYTL